MFRLLLVRLKGRGKAQAAKLCLLLSLLLLFGTSVSRASKNLLRVMQGEEVRGYGAYTLPAMEVYRYIQDNTPEDSVIVFFKPRALYLNTGRESTNRFSRGNEPCDRDYYLIRKEMGAADKAVLRENGQRLFPLLENEEFIFYRIGPDTPD